MKRPNTIAWTAYDDAGHGEGIGSRFFGVANTGTVTAVQSPLPSSAVTHRESKAGRVATYRRGFQRRTAFESLNPGGTIELGEMDRLELHVGEGSTIGNLPPGATFDADSGTFYWGTAPGLLGRYELVFYGRNGEGLRVPVIVGRIPALNQ